MLPEWEDATALDLIGDIHGCCEALTRLLQRLGYREVEGVYRHPEGRKAIFVGDLIDRGDQIPETCRLVKSMYDDGQAQVVLGNHEINAIRYGETIQGIIDSETDVEHNLPDRTLRAMHETIAQYRPLGKEWIELVDWLKSLPLFIDGERYRVVHACWDGELINRYRDHYHTAHMTPEFLEASMSAGSLEYRIIDRLTRGLSMPLPEGMALESKDGFIRRAFRTKFWDRSVQTYGDVVFQPDPLPYDFAEQPINSDHRKRIIHYGEEEVPVFFGHYWLKGRPKPLTDNVACLDYSAVKLGRLTAYRFNGEQVLSRENFVWVYVGTEEQYDET